MLDTNAVIQVMRRNPAVIARLTQQSPADCLISSIVAHELFYGAYKGSRVAENLRRIDAMKFEILAFDTEDARSAGEVRASLAIAGTPIGPYDVLIAGQALARRLVLVTNNVREFSRVPGLAYEDWQR